MPDTTKPLSEIEIRKIAHEEALKVNQELLKEIAEVRDSIRRIERLLLGELGVNEEDTLKSRANFAYQYAKKNTDAKIIERATPALEWFHDMNTTEVGCKESKLVSLGKMITFYTNIKWFFGLIGFTTLLNTIPVIKGVVDWLTTL